MLDESPDDDEVLYNLGVVYGEAKRTDEALAAFWPFVLLCMVIITAYNLSLKDGPEGEAFVQVRH